MRDALGNKLQKGQLVHWRPNEAIAHGGIIAHVMDVIEPNITAIDGGKSGRRIVLLQIAIDVTVPPQAKNDDVVYAEVMRVVDPASEAALDRVMQ